MITFQFLFLILTYLIAAIPFGLVLAKIFAKVDIRQHGSKNIGATNVARVAGKKLGFLTLILDGLKGAFMIIIARFAFYESSNLHLFLSLVGFAAVIGHIYPIYLKFKGGKGVATTIAVLLALDSMVGISVIAVWIMIFALFRISSISSMVAILSSILLSYFYHSPIEQVIFCAALSLLVIYRHKENIARLMSGEEKKNLIAKPKKMPASEKLIVALDFPDFDSAKKLVQELGDEVIFYKIGLELLMSGDYFKLLAYLKANGKKVFCDLKLYDISQTVSSAVKNLAKYNVDLLTIHSASYDIMARAAEHKGDMQLIAVTVLTNLDSHDLLDMGFDANISLEDLVIKKTKLSLRAGLDGIVSSGLEARALRENFEDDFLIVSPGIRLEKILNDDQKRTCDVNEALGNGSSHLVVGRPISRGANPQEMARKFNQAIHESCTNIK